jgi:hypothetical protein
MIVTIWIGTVEFAPETIAKLHTKHSVAEHEVREAVCFGAHDRAVWDDDPDYGLRLVVTGRSAAGRRIIAYLRPIDPAGGDWECRTAWGLDN